MNEIDGWDHSRTTHVGVPAISGMNFQTVSTAEKLFSSQDLIGGGGPVLPGGYLPGTTTPGPLLSSALGLAKIYAGREAARFFGVPTSDPRHPDMFGRVQVGVVYSGGTKIAEHGGDNPADRDVPIVVYTPRRQAPRV